MHYRYNNVITLRSFSKAYGLGGLRIGYGFAHHDLISNLMKVKVPFEPSIPAQIAGCAALEDLDFLNIVTSNCIPALVLLYCGLFLFLPILNTFLVLDILSKD